MEPLYAPTMPGNTSSEFDVDDDPPSPPPSDAPAPPFARFANVRRRWLAALVIVAVVGTGFYVVTGGRLFANIPPEGTIWFGTSFDPDTFDVRGQLTSVGADEEFVMVGRLPRPLAGSRLVIRGYRDDALITIAWTANTDEGAMWGFNLGPIAMPGTWRYEIAEVGGSALASGQFVVRQ
jgi:hypothetical protein